MTYKYMLSMRPSFSQKSRTCLSIMVPAKKEERRNWYIFYSKIIIPTDWTESQVYFEIAHAVVTSPVLRPIYFPLKERPHISCEYPFDFCKTITHKNGQYMCHIYL